MGRMRRSHIGRENIKFVLYVIGIILALGFLSTIFYKPVIFVQGITFVWSLWGLALPAGITYFLYAREAYDASVRTIVWISLPVILFFGVLLPISGTVGMPGLLNVIQPAVCPVGFDEIQGDIATRQFDMPGKVISVKMISFCTGELGAYQPGRGPLILGGLFIYALYCGMYLSLVLVIWKQKFFVFRPFVAQGIILALFIPLLFVTLLNPSFRLIISKPVKGLIYRGHAVSLVEAVKRHKVGMIRDLLARGGDINAKNDNHETALGVAQKFNDKEVLDLFAGQITGGSDAKKALLDKGIVYDAPNYFKCVQNNDIECVKLFLDAGMDINAVGSYQGAGPPVPDDTALAIAARKGHKDLVQLLLDRKADVNAVNLRPGAKGRTPIYAAVRECRDDIVRLLIQRGADVNAKDKYGNTALMMASGEEGICPAAARTLVENKADVSARKSDGNTALLYAVDTINYDEINKEKYDLVKYLLEHGADPNVNNFDTGKTPLRIARERKAGEVVELLQQYHARE